MRHVAAQREAERGWHDARRDARRDAHAVLAARRDARSAKKDR